MWFCLLIFPKYGGFTKSPFGGIMKKTAEKEAYMKLSKKKQVQSENYKRANDKSKDERHRRYVYAHTEKPEHYVHVDEPKTLQDERQVQYNNWCKRNGVYNGSYLPVNPDTLTERGWSETTSPKRNKQTGRDFERKSSGQKVEWNDGKDDGFGWEDEHYHWRDPNGGSSNDNLDRYGRPSRDRRAIHLAPLDRDYRYVEHKEKNKKGKKKK